MHSHLVWHQCSVHLYAIQNGKWTLATWLCAMQLFCILQFKMNVTLNGCFILCGFCCCDWKAAHFTSLQFNRLDFSLWLCNSLALVVFNYNVWLQGKHTLVRTKLPEKINLPENAKQEQTECTFFGISNKIRLKMIFKLMCDRDRKWNA